MKTPPKKLSDEERASLLRNIERATKFIERKGNITSYDMRASDYILLGRYEEALADYSKLIELAPSADYYAKRANLYDTLKRDKQALADYTRAIELEPTTVRRYIERGHFYFKRKKYSKACADYVKAVEIAPEFIFPYPSIFEKTLNEHRLAGYTRNIEREPSTWNYEYRGRYYLKQKKYNLALADYKRAVDLEPNHNLTESLEDFEESLNAHRLIGYTKNIERDPSPSNLWLRADLYFKLGKYAQAVDDYTQVIDWCNCYGKRGTAYYYLGRYDEAIRDFKEAIDRSFSNDERAIYYHNCGLAHLKAKRYDEAAQCFSEAIECYPDYQTAYYDRGMTYFYLGQYKAALADLEEYICREPDDLDAYELRGKCYRALGDDSKAQADFARIGIKGRRLF